MTDQAVLVFLGVIVLGVLLGLYITFWPWRIAKRRGHRNSGAIFILCLFFGWTLLGWVAALLWAVYNEKGASA